MTDKQIIIDGVDVSFCPNHYNGWSALHRDTRAMCECGYDRECRPKDFECSHYVKCLEKQLQRKTEECEDLRQYHNKCCKEFEIEKQQLIEKHSQVSKDFYNGKFCNKEHCNLLNAKEQECEELKSLLKVRIEDLCDSCGASSMMPMPCKVYEKTLTEIKEIAEAHKKDESVWNPYRQLDRILQKISEVEE